MNNFDLKAYMDVTPEIEEAVRTGSLSSRWKAPFSATACRIRRT